MASSHAQADCDGSPTSTTTVTQLIRKTKTVLGKRSHSDSDEPLTPSSTKISKSKRPNSDSDETLTCDSGSDNNVSPPRSFDSYMNEAFRSSSESPILDIPLNTSEWTEETIFNRLEIQSILSLSPIGVFSSGYYGLITDDKERDRVIEDFHSHSQEKQAKHDCFQFAVKEAININYEFISDIPVSEAIKINMEYKKPFKESCFQKWLDTYLIGKSEDMKDLIREICQNDTPNVERYCLKIGENFVKSEPDAVICMPAQNCSDLEDKVIAVVEVKKEYSKNKDVYSEKTTRNSKLTTTLVEHVNSKLKGQHVGEMIAALPSSVFGPKGIYGIIVQGTNITFVSLVAKDGFFEKITTGYTHSTGAVVKYSKECNMLLKDGREELGQTFLGMGTLLQLLR